MTVYDLTKDEIDELKTALFYEQDADEIFDGIEYYFQIPDDFIYQHYEGVTFVKGDFFCNTGLPF